VPDRIVGDAGRFRQVIVNLVGNAIKFTEDGEVVVRVAANVGDQSALIELQCSVEDTGIGIPADKLHTIFDPFAQADGSTTRKYGGTGLGLTICQRLVGLMGGRIWAERRVGGGTTFHFTVQAERASTTDSARPHAIAESTVSLPIDTRPLRILLAEDNPVNQLVMRGLLSKQGHSVHVAGDGRAALDALANATFDLVMMDVQMPGMDGFETTAAIRERERQTNEHVVIVALTAHAMKGDAERCLAAGMDAYLSKPISLSALNEVLASVARRLNPAA
jgi:CheY-like chemotaxis protein